MSARNFQEEYGIEAFKLGQLRELDSLGREREDIGSALLSIWMDDKLQTARIATVTHTRARTYICDTYYNDNLSIDLIFPPIFHIDTMSIVYISLILSFITNYLYLCTKKVISIMTIFTSETRDVYIN